MAEPQAERPKLHGHRLVRMHVYPLPTARRAPGVGEQLTVRAPAPERSVGEAGWSVAEELQRVRRMTGAVP